MKARVVIGANFGDEGKGLMTDYLCSQGADVVVRFNGGAQAGHTVVTPSGDRHIFRHFGSGSMLGVPTFLSQFFVCNPILFFEELKQLTDLGLTPSIYAHPECLITTFIDMLINQKVEQKRAGKRHGSCGVGFHETIVRSGVKELKITIGDLWNGGKRLESQLTEICGKYFSYRCKEKFDNATVVEEFIKCCHEFANVVNPLGMGQCKNPVFEGAQGLLLDQNNKEYFPHLTHSNTGMKNVRVLCAQAGITDIETFYITRSYLTRHGAGPLPSENPMMVFEDETNQPNAFQGTLRFAPLDVHSLYKRCSNDVGGNRYKIVVTHCDQLEPDPAINTSLFSTGPTRDHLSRVFKPAGALV